MTNKLKLTKLFLVMVLSVFALSCEKESDNEHKNPLANAKTWYLNRTLNAKTALKSNTDQTQSVTTTFDWDKSKIFEMSNGTQVVGTPVGLIKSDGKNVAGSYMLLIYKIGNEYDAEMIYNKTDNYFANEPSNSDIEATFIVSRKNTAIKSLEKSQAILSKGTNGKLMVREAKPPVCTDWYWTTYAYDSYGNIIEVISEVYLYTTCTDGSEGEGGGTVPDDEQNCSNTEANLDGEASSTFLTSSFGEEISSERPAVYRWVPFKHKFGMWRYISVEDAKHEKVNGIWRFKSFTHRHVVSDGNTLLITKTLTTSGIEIIMTDTQAAIRYDIHFEASAICKGFPIETVKNTSASSPLFTTANGNSH